MKEKDIILGVLESYLRTGSAQQDGIKVSRLQNNKTSCVEQIDGEGRAVMLDEFQVDGKPIWAGYSTHSQTVYVSLIGVD